MSAKAWITVCLFGCLFVCFEKKSKETSRENWEKLYCVPPSQEDSVPFGPSRGSVERVSLVSYTKGEVAGVLMSNSLVESYWQVLPPPWYTLPMAKTGVVGPSSRENVFSPSAEGASYGGTVPGMLRKGCENG